MIRIELSRNGSNLAGVIPLSLSYLQEPGRTSCSTSTTPLWPPSGPWVLFLTRCYRRSRHTKTHTMPSTSPHPSHPTSMRVGTFHSITHASVYPLSHQYIHLFIHSSIQPPPTYTSIHISSRHAPIPLSIHPFTHRFLYLYIHSLIHFPYIYSLILPLSHTSNCPSTHLSIFLSIPRLIADAEDLNYTLVNYYDDERPSLQGIRQHPWLRWRSNFTPNL